MGRGAGLPGAEHIRVADELPGEPVGHLVPLGHHVPGEHLAEIGVPQRLLELRQVGRLHDPRLVRQHVQVGADRRQQQVDLRPVLPREHDRVPRRLAEEPVEVVGPGADLDLPVGRLILAGVEGGEPAEVGDEVGVDRRIDEAPAGDAREHPLLHERGVEVSRGGSLESDQRPDVILAEPVGSCTDLVATAIQPLKDLYGGKFEVAPYAVLFKPSHGTRILRDQPAGGFSPKAAYIFKKQLEEADAILINRSDELTPAEQEELTRLVGERFPGTPVLRVSAQTGAGFDRFVELLDQKGAFGRRILDIDYDTYAEGEAELGWLNASVRLTAEKPFDLDALLTGILRELAGVRRKLAGEGAHLKLIGRDDAGAVGVG